MKKSVNIESPVDKILQEDIEYVANSEINLESIKNATILITGSTGLIGSQIVKSLICCNRLKNTNIKILAVARNKEKAKHIYKDVLSVDNFDIIKADILEEIVINEKIDYIIHTASVTSSKYFVTKPVETIDTIVSGTKNVLELARTNKVKSVVYLSSMEVFGQTNPKLAEISENDLGYIDILSVRSSYSEGKRMAENLCIAYQKQYGVPVKIARLAQTFGPSIGIEENRIFAQIARCAIDSNDIVLRTKGESIGNYCYTRDAIIAILILLNKGVDGDAYIISNPNSIISIKDMAKMVIDKINNKINLIFDIPKDEFIYGYAPTTKMHLNPSKMKALGWKPEVNLEESYIRMIQSMKDTKNG